MPAQVPPTGDEKSQLLAYIAQQRDGVRYAAYGLTDEQARQTPTASTLSVGGLLKHVAFTERGWIETVIGRSTREPGAVGAAAYEDNFRFGPGDTLEAALAELDAVAALTEAELADLDLDAPVPVPDEPWFPKDVEAWSVRWVLLHLVEELARHAGHADIIRESIDGATMYELQAAAEGWPATEWLTPWSAKPAQTATPPAGEDVPAQTVTPPGEVVAA